MSEMKRLIIGDGDFEIVDESARNQINDVYEAILTDNLLPYPHANTTKTVNGITFTDNGDGTVTASGTATKQATYNLSTNFTGNGTVNLSGCPEGGNTNTYTIQAYPNSASGNYYDVGDGVSINLSNERTYTIRIRIQSGTTANNLLFKPMIAKGNIKKPYVRYDYAANVLRSDVDALKNSAVITPEMYGAKGDGVTDDTEAIQDCIDDNPNANIVFGDGIYRVTDTITIHAGYVAQTIMLGMIVYDGETNADGAVIDIVYDKTSATGAFGGITLIGGSISCNWKMGTGIRNNAFSTRIISTSVRYYTAYGIDNGSDDITSRSDAISSSLLLDSCMITQFPEQTGTAIRLMHSDNKIVNCNINGCNIGIELTAGGNYIANTHFTVCGQNTETQDASSAFIYNNPFNSSMNELNTFSNCYFNGFAPKYIVNNAISNAMVISISDGGIILGATSYDKKTYLCSSNYCKLALDNVNLRHTKGTHRVLGVVRFTGAAAPYGYNTLSINDMVAPTTASNTANTCDLSNTSQNPRVVISSNGTLAAHTLRKIGYIVQSTNSVGMAEFIVYISSNTIVKMYVSNTECFKVTSGTGSAKIDFYVDSASSLVSDDEFEYKVRGLYVYNKSDAVYSTGVNIQIGDQPYPSVQSFLWDYVGADETEITDLSNYTLISEA